MKKENAFNRFLETPFFRRFMAVAYGLGASLVILGALFKINHYNGATEMLLIGMVTEAIIFALSALQKPHVEPDWSKVHPEFIKDYHGIEPDDGLLQPKAGARQSPAGGQFTQLDMMLKDVELDEGVIHRLGTGLTKLSESASKLNDLTGASLATQEFVSNMRTASQSASNLSKSYNDTSLAINKEREVTNDLTSRKKEVSTAASGLKDAYGDATKTLREDLRSTEELSETIKTTSQSAAKLSESYFKSAESISKTIDELKNSSTNGEAFNQQLSKLSENLASLNKLYEMQLANSQVQSKASADLQQTLDKFLASIEESSNKTVQYQHQMDTLTKRMASLNSVYGNMLSAMNIK
jgi:gliding motility-associated protein GldL